MLESLKGLIISYGSVPVERLPHWSLEQHQQELEHQLYWLKMAHEYNGGW